MTTKNRTQGRIQEFAKGWGWDPSFSRVWCRSARSGLYKINLTLTLSLHDTGIKAVGLSWLFGHSETMDLGRKTCLCGRNWSVQDCS